jgi:TatD DNase family protein
MSKKKHQTLPAIAPESLGLPPAGVDSHAHLDLRHFGQDLELVLLRAKRAGVARIGNVFLSVEAWREGRDLFARHPEVFFLLGIHPTDAAGCAPETLEAMRGAFRSDARLKALGEIGLDYYWKDCPPPVQRAAFIAQLALARELGKPVVIHCRDAFADCLDLLVSQGLSGYPLLWHCFGGDAEQAETILSHGWHISVPGPVSFPANAALREAVRRIPLSRLMTETDCPYLAPIPYRGKRNEPAYAVFAAQAMAEARGMDAAGLWTACGATARAFFGLDAREDAEAPGASPKLSE